MTQGDPNGSFRSDLDQLGHVAATAVPELVRLLEQQVTVLDEFNGITTPLGFCTADLALRELTATLRERAKQAAVAVSEAGIALADVAALYRRADGQG